MRFLRRYPKSLLRLILIGYAMVLVPLLGAGLYAVYSVTQLQRDGVVAIDGAVRTVRYGLQMAERIEAMERVFRQHQILGEPALLGEYGLLRQQWREAADAFGQVALAGPIASEIRASVAVEERAFQAYRSNPRDEARAGGLAATLVGIRESTSRNLARTDTLLDDLVARFKSDARTMVLRLLIVLLAAVPLSLAIVVGFRSTFRGLLTQFEDAIRSLGRGEMDHEIRLDGPSDMRFVGRRLEWLRRRLRELESQRNQFLRNASHELKTPLAAVREGAHLLLDGVAGALSPQQRKVAEIMATSAGRLQGLIDDLLRMQQAAYDAERIRPRELALDELLRGVLEGHVLAAKQRGIRLVGQLGASMLQGGADQLRIVFENLISNAIKYSPDGGCVHVSARLADECAVVDVRDDGPGISPGERARIFEAFVRLQRTESVEGNGLGLAIAREFVSAHRGTIEVLDAEKGAHFRVSLPVSWQRA